MSRSSRFYDTKAPNGRAITVEYLVESAGSPTTYSALSGASGGDAAEITIKSVWYTDDAGDCQLSTEELEVIEGDIIANVDFGDDDDDYLWVFDHT